MGKNWVLFINIMLLLWGTAKSQEYHFCQPVTNPDAILHYNEAVDLFSKNKRQSLVKLEQALNITPNFVEARYLYAVINFLIGQNFLESEIISTKVKQYYHKSSTNFIFVISKCPKLEEWSSYYYLGTISYNLKDYKATRKYLQAYLKHEPSDSIAEATAQSMLLNIQKHFELIDNPVPFNPISLKGGINTGDDEYLPVISPDGELIFYTHRYVKRSNTAANLEEVEEFTVSMLDFSADSLNPIFTPGRKLEAPFNDGRNQGGASITIDNNQIFITICDYKRGAYTSYKDCDIFFSEYTDGNWLALKNLGTTVNSANTFEGQPAITGDGSVLFFVSNRTGGYGGLDIYQSVRDVKGNWGKPLNLGPVINSAGDDKTPFIHTDSQTLYFTSNGRFGMGGFDIFYSQYSGMGYWEEPKNMGYPINSANDELAYTVSADGNRMYFASKSLNKQDNWDLYTSELYHEARPKKVLFVKGTLYDNNGAGASDARITLTGINNNTQTTGMIDKTTGKYAVAVQLDETEKYVLTARKQGHVFRTAYLNTIDSVLRVPTVIDFHLDSLKNDTAYYLENVYFDFNSDSLEAVGKVCIARLGDLLIENPDLSVEILGHTDDQGGETFNKTLARKRAEAVRQYLISMGVNGTKVKAISYGESKPMSSGTDDASRAKNRRTEFVLRKIE